MKLNTVNLREVLKYEAEVIQPMEGLTINFHEAQGFLSKPTDKYGMLRNKFRDESESRTEHKPKVSKELFIDALNNGYVHVLVDIKGVKSLKDQVKGKDGVFKSNIMCFDIDCKVKNDGTVENQLLLDRIKEFGSVRKFEDELRRHFHILQRSISWTKEYPRYHGYIILSEDVLSYDKYVQLYAHIKNELIEKLNIEFDRTIEPLKMICAGKRGSVSFNKYLPKYNIPYELLINKPKEEIERKENKINYGEVDNNLLRERLEEVTNLQAYKLSDYEDWRNFIAGLVNLEINGVLTTADIEAIAEAVDDGNAHYIQKFEEFRRSPLTEIGVGTVIYWLNEIGVDTRGIFNTSYEKHVVGEGHKNLKVVKFNKYLSSNPQVVEVIEEALDQKGKLILMVAPTGAGKSYALINEIHKAHERKKGLKMFTTPRTKLKDNQAKDFMKGEKCLAVDGTQIQNEEITDEEVEANNNFITTYDNAPTISNICMDIQAETEEPHNLIITDEAHMLITDTEFKADKVRNYLDFEDDARKNLDAVTIHVTATPDYMDYMKYDQVIIFEKEDEKDPFKEAYYYQFPKDTNMKTAFLQEVALHGKNLLVFVENKNYIKEYADKLRNRYNLNVVTITSESNMSEDAISDQEVKDRIAIVKHGLIPSHVNIILATSTIGAGVSITNNTEDWQTWVLITKDSRNSCPVSIRQYANRLRKEYKELRLYVPYIKENATQHEYRLHQLAEEHFEEALETAVRYSTALQNKHFFKLTKEEERLGLYRTESVVGVYAERIYSYHIDRRKDHNINNPLCLINYLNRCYNTTFKNGGFALASSKDLEEEMKQDKQLLKGEAEEVVGSYLSNEEALVDIYTNKDTSSDYKPFLDAVQTINKNKAKSVRRLLHIKGLDKEEVKTAVTNIINGKNNFAKDMEVFDQMNDPQYATLREAIRRVEESPIMGVPLLKDKLEEELEKILDGLTFQQGNKYKPFTPKMIRNYFVEEKEVKKGEDRKSYNVHKLTKKIDHEVIKERYGFDPTWGFDKLETKFIVMDDLECPFV